MFFEFNFKAVLL